MHVNRVWTEGRGKRFSPREQRGDLGASCWLQGMTPVQSVSLCCSSEGPTSWGPARPPPSGRRRTPAASEGLGSWEPALPPPGQETLSGPARRVLQIVCVGPCPVVPAGLQGRPPQEGDGGVKRPHSSSSRGWNSGRTAWQLPCATLPSQRCQ